MLIKKAPREVDKTFDPPLEREKKAELVGLSTVRLTAKPVGVVFKDVPEERHREVQRQKNGAVDEVMGSGEAEVGETRQGGRGDSGGRSEGVASGKRKGLEGLKGAPRQAAFLEQLAEIKRAKGERDQVPLTGVRTKKAKPARGGISRGVGRASAAGRGDRERTEQGEANPEVHVRPQTWEPEGDAAGGDEEEDDDDDNVDDDDTGAELPGMGILDFADGMIEDEPQGDSENDDSGQDPQAASDIEMEDA